MQTRTLLPFAIAGLAAIPAVASAEAPACEAQVCADLKVTSVLSPVRLGQDATITTTVLNAGPQPASRVRVDLTIPRQLEFRSGASSVGLACTWQSGVESCPVDALAVGQKAVITTKFRSTEQGTFDVEHRVTSSGTYDPIDPGTNATTAVRVPAMRSVATVKGDAEHILKTGGVTLRISPKLSGLLTVSGTVSTPSGPATLTSVQVRAAKKGKTVKVFLGTRPAVLAKIRKGLATHRRLRTRITVTAAGGTTGTSLYVQR
jgi:uncharacterized repeat protein (TIGR01451 family)